MEIQRESIFVSSLRGFCRSLFALLGAFVAIFFAVWVAFALSSPYTPEQKTSLELLPDLNGKRELVALDTPVILQISIHGEIGDSLRLDSNTIDAILLDSREGILQHDRVKAVLLHIDTPGGTSIDSDNIYRALLKYKKKYNVPIFAYVDGLCASGGMYIACAVDRIYCSPSSIIGSVGVVFGPFFNVSDAMAKIGIQGRALTEGLEKDMMSPIRPWKPDEDESLKQLASYFYNQFVDIVVAARPQIDRTKLVNEYGAKVFDGPSAQKLGYVDVANSDYETTLTALMTEAKIDPTKPYQVVGIQPHRSFWDLLFRGHSFLTTGRIEHKLQIGSKNSDTIKDRFAYLYQPNG